MHDTVPYLGETLHRWTVGRSTFLAAPERGARLMHWGIELPDGTPRDVIHWPEIQSFEGFQSVRGGNPILFPFCARSFDHGDIHFWRDADGIRRPMPMHGFARQGCFELTWVDDAGFSAVLKPDAIAQKAYPFDYEFTVIYKFSATSLTCEFVLKNLGTQPLPWSAGHHFYFSVPWESERSRADYRLTVPSARRVKQDAGGQLATGPLFAATEALDRAEWIDTIHLNLSSPVAKLAPADAPEGAILISIGLDKKQVPAPDAAFVTWSASPESPFFCVEPWMGPPNAAEHKVGLHTVAPGKSQSFVVEVALAS